MTNIARFNKTLPAAAVVVATENLYNDNDGPYSVAHVFNKEENTITTHNYANGYNRWSYLDAEVDATKEEIAEAVNVFQSKENYRLWNMKYGPIGCTVVLQRSRKAPNKVPLEIIDYSAGGFNPRYYCHEPERIAVKVEDRKVWVSRSCIKEYVKGPEPFWS